MKKVLLLIALISFVNVFGQTQVGNDFIIPNGKLQIGSNSNNGSPGAKIEVLSRYASNQDEAIRIGFKQSGDLNFYGLGLNFRTSSTGGPSNHLVYYSNGKRWDAMTFANDGNIGILTNGAERIRITKDGNVGIGTTTPSYRFHVRGDTYLQGTQSIDGRMHTNLFWRGHNLIMGSPKGVYAHNYLQLKPGGSSSGLLHSNIELFQATNENEHKLSAKIASSGVSFFNGGNVGIGTTNTFGYKLAVNGIIGAKEVRVEISSAWPDYVFTKNYQLPSLESLENQIKECGHLPNMPSAKEVQQEGIALGEMNVKLLEKIEELTLYTIEQEKKIKEQEVRLAKLEKLLLKN